MKTKKAEYHFNSLSSNKVYVTTEYNDNTFSCNCPAWIFKKRDQERNCKHIEEVKFRKENTEIAVQKLKKENQKCPYVENVE